MSNSSASSFDPTSPLEVSENKVKPWKSIIGLCVSGGVILLGLGVLGFAIYRFYAVTRGIGLVAPGATLVVAGLTAMMAQLGIESWSEQKRKDRSNAEYRHREEMYVRLAKLMVSQISGGYDVKEDHSLRAEVAVWGSQSVVKTQAEWQSFIASLSSSGGSISLDRENGIKAEKLLANSILAMRSDLESDVQGPPTQRDVRRSILNTSDDDFVE